jgi:hypothetical protein
MKHKSNLSTKYSALDLLRMRAAGGPAVVTCVVVPRPQPIKQSSLSPYLDQMRHLKDEGRSLREIADWIYATTGTRPNKSTVCRQLQRATARDQP